VYRTPGAAELDGRGNEAGVRRAEAMRGFDSVQVTGRNDRQCSPVQ
jgi:hypothetical protein